MRHSALLMLAILGCDRPSEPPQSAPPPVLPAPLSGSIDGVVRLAGTLAADKLSGIPRNVDLPALRTVVAGDGGTLANVYVAVKSGLGNRRFSPPKDPVILSQVRLVYSPRVIGIMTGQILEIRNSDDILHNVHFPLGVRPGG